MCKFLIILPIVVLSLVACRKKIDHKLGTTVAQTNGNGPVFPSIPGEWTHITPASILDVRALKSFNGNLYVGGGFENTSGTVKAIARITTNEFFQQVYDGQMAYDGINDFEIYNGELIVGGRYGLYTGTNKIALSRMSTNETFSPINFTSYILDEIYSITQFNGDLVVTGGFSPSGSNSVQTSNVEILQNYTPTGLADVSYDVYGATVHNGELYICGDDNDILKWTGTGWTSIAYNNSAWNDELFDLISYNSELYVLGDFNSTYGLKKMDSQGVWGDVSEVTHVGNHGVFIGLRVLNNELYVLSKDIQVSGNTPTGVAKFDGTDWSPVGVIDYEVRDIEFFNNKLYIATENGVYRFN